MQYIAALVLIFNLAAFSLMGIDKRRAIKSRWRIPERTLLLACVPFSAIGGWIGMQVFHHKTLKPKFRFGVPAMLIAQIALIAVLCARFGGFVF